MRDRFKEVHFQSGSSLIFKKIKRTKIYMRLLAFVAILGIVAFFAGFTLQYQSPFSGMIGGSGLILLTVFAAVYPLLRLRQEKLFNQLSDYDLGLERAKIDAQELAASQEFQDHQADTEEDDWQKNRKRPEPQPFGVSDEGA